MSERLSDPDPEDRDYDYASALVNAIDAIDKLVEVQKRVATFIAGVVSPEYLSEMMTRRSQVEEMLAELRSWEFDPGLNGFRDREAYE